MEIIQQISNIVTIISVLCLLFSSSLTKVVLGKITYRYDHGCRDFGQYRVSFLFDRTQNSHQSEKTRLKIRFLLELIKFTDTTFIEFTVRNPVIQQESLKLLFSEENKTRDVYNKGFTFYVPVSYLSESRTRINVRICPLISHILEKTS